MVETIITILIFIAVIVVTAVLFGGWLVVTVVTAVGRLLLWPFRGRARGAQTEMLTTTATDAARCPNERCRAENPAVAAFCRRCGGSMRAVQRVPVRRVAMW